MASVSVLIVPELWILLGKCLPAVYTIWVTMKSLSKAAWTPAGTDLFIASTCFYRYKIGPDSSGADGGVPKAAILYSHPPCSPCWLWGLAGRNLGWGALEVSAGMLGMENPGGATLFLFDQWALLMTMSDSHLPEYVAHIFWEGGTYGIWKQRRFRCP